MKKKLNRLWGTLAVIALLPWFTYAQTSQCFEYEEKLSQPVTFGAASDVAHALRIPSCKRCGRKSHADRQWA